MTEFRVPRHNNLDLVFEGELLGFVSSQERGSTRWSELRLYKTENNRYVVEQVGKSAIPGEVDKINVRIADNPEEVKRALRRKDNIEYFTLLALDLLAVAAEKDPALSAAMTERI